MVFTDLESGMSYWRYKSSETLLGIETLNLVRLISWTGATKALKPF